MSAPMGRKALFVRRSRPCGISPGDIRCSAAGWWITPLAASRSARTKIRSPATAHASCRTRLSSRDHLEPERCAGTAGRVRLVEAALVRIRPERVGNPDNGFGCTQHQHAVRLDRLCDALEDSRLGLLVEIDQDVAAEDDVEFAEAGEVLHQVELAILHHPANV